MGVGTKVIICNLFKTETEDYYNGDLFISNLVKFKISCKVRNEVNGLRKLDERESVITSLPSQLPVMPRPFPAGRWKVQSVRNKTINGKPSSIFGNYFIATDAFIDLPIWEIDTIDGSYKHETNKFTKDIGYGLHASPASSTTLGCIRLNSIEDADKIVSYIDSHIKDNTILLEVNYR